MFKIEDAEGHCEYLAGGDDEGDYVLLELPDQPVDEDLPQEAQHSDGQVID